MTDRKQSKAPGEGVTSAVASFLRKLAQQQVRRPLLFVFIALFVTIGSLPIAMRLTLNGDIAALLPDTAPSVVDLEQMVDRFGVASTLSVAVQAPDRDTAFEATRALGQRLEQADDPDLVSVDWGLEQFQDFVERHKHLYADKDFLEKFQKDLHARVEWEVEHESPFALGLDDDLDVQEPPTIEELKQRLEDEAERAQADLPKYDQGVFSHTELPLAVIFLRTNIDSKRLPDSKKLIARIKDHLAELKQANPKFGPVYLEFGGDLMDTAYETELLATQMAFATTLTLIAVMLAVYFFFRSWRAVPLLGLAIIPPVAATFAVAQLAVGFLNTSTAFLMSIVIGNGINPNVIWLARYFEERVDGNEGESAIFTSHRSTWAATLVASMAAGLAYASLAITDFRGFRDFGIIGGVGMLLCWLSAYLLLPAIALVGERIRPVRPKRDASNSNPYGRFFGWLAFSRPRTALAVGAVITVISAVALVIAILRNPIEYDFRNLTSERNPDNRITWVNQRQGEIVSETTTGSAIAILAPSRQDAPVVVEKLKAYREQHPDILGPIRSIDSLLPDAQAEKLPIIRDLREDLLRARKFADPDERDELEKHIPPEDLEPITAEDLPEDVARTFTEQDGTLGRLVFSEHHTSQNNWDGKYWMQWAEAVRSFEIDGKRPPSTGNPMVFADVLHSLATEGPLAIIAALTSTILLLLFSLRRWRDRLLTLGALLAGILWMAGAMALCRIKLNFLNFVAFPVTFGNGVDYGVNVISRHIVEEEKLGDSKLAIREAVERTGGAVVLCSLTTIIGYISLYTSSNKALNSFGAAMAISEITCVATAVLVMPAWLILHLEKKSAAAAKQAKDVAPTFDDTSDSKRT